MAKNDIRYKNKLISDMEKHTQGFLYMNKGFPIDVAIDKARELALRVLDAKSKSEFSIYTQVVCDGVDDFFRIYAEKIEEPGDVIIGEIAVDVVVADKACKDLEINSALIKFEEACKGKSVREVILKKARHKGMELYHLHEAVTDKYGDYKFSTRVFDLDTFSSYFEDDRIEEIKKNKDNAIIVLYNVFS